MRLYKDDLQKREGENLQNLNYTIYGYPQIQMLKIFANIKLVIELAKVYDRQQLYYPK
jgi:hypothetical protein